MLRDKITRVKFKIAAFKVKRSYMRLMKHYLKVLKFCILTANKIAAPTSKEEVRMMTEVLSLYDKTIVELSDRMREYRRLLDYAVKE